MPLSSQINAPVGQNECRAVSPEIMERENKICFAELDQKGARSGQVVRITAKQKTLCSGRKQPVQVEGLRRRRRAVAQRANGTARGVGQVKRVGRKGVDTAFRHRSRFAGTGSNMGGAAGRRQVPERSAQDDPQNANPFFHSARIREF